MIFDTDKHQEMNTPKNLRHCPHSRVEEFEEEESNEEPPRIRLKRIPDIEYAQPPAHNFTTKARSTMV